jgi:hypothetical protein
MRHMRVGVQVALYMTSCSYGISIQCGLRGKANWCSHWDTWRTPGKVWTIGLVKLEKTYSIGGISERFEPASIGDKTFYNALNSSSLVGQTSLRMYLADQTLVRCLKWILSAPLPYLQLTSLSQSNHHICPPHHTHDKRSTFYPYRTYLPCPSLPSSISLHTPTDLLEVSHSHPMVNN